jgi:hypothetical protein
LGRKGIELTAPAEGAFFDLIGDGLIEKFSWITGEDGFLALDRNHNGRIDNGTELFGNHTMLSSGEVASNGYEALGELDADRDGFITIADPAYQSLRVWIDSNRNGLTEYGELVTLAAAHVAAVGVETKLSRRVDEWGNEFKLRSVVVMTNHHAVASYDVFLKRASLCGMPE